MKLQHIVIFLTATTFFSCNKTEKKFDASGSFEAEETIISAEAAGTIKEFTIAESQELKAGQQIGYIDSTQLFLKKKQLLASINAVLSKRPDIAVQLGALDEQLVIAEKEKQRMTSLVASGAGTQKQLDDVIAQIASREGRTIFFVRTKHGADKLTEKLKKQGVDAGVLHGGRTQKQRMRVLDAFKIGKKRALIATDVAARGIHVDDVSLVVHVDPPETHKDYLHRAGRTARAGAKGTVAVNVLSKASGAYPIASFSYGLAYGSGKDAEKQKAVKEFMTFVLGDCAAKYAVSKGYSPVTGRLADIAKASINDIG